MKRIILLVSLGFFLNGFNSFAQTNNVQKNLEETLGIDICELAFHTVIEMIAAHPSATKHPEKGYYIQVDSKDPSPKLLALFSTNNPSVFKGSAFREGEGMRLNIIEPGTPSTNATVKVLVLAHKSLCNGFGDELEMVDKDGKWSVKSRTRVIIE